MENKVNYNAGKWFDVRKTAELFCNMQKAAEDYCKKSEETGVAYQSFVASEAFMGKAADETKNFVGNGMGSMNIKVADEHKKCIQDQIDILDGFRTMVDSSPYAYIDYDVLEAIDTDFVGYHGKFSKIADSVDLIIGELNKEFGKKYGEFPEPNKGGVNNSFADFCSAGGNGGYVKECQNKFITFDNELTDHISKHDTEAFSNDINSKISKSTEALNEPIAPQFNTNPNVKALWGIDIPFLDEFIDDCKDFWKDLFSDIKGTNPYDDEGSFGGSAQKINWINGYDVNTSDVALANTVFYLAKDLSDEEFEKAFDLKRLGNMDDLNYTGLAQKIHDETNDLEGYSEPDKLLYFLRSHGLDAEIERIPLSADLDSIYRLQDILKDGYAVNCCVEVGTVEHFLKNEHLDNVNVSVTGMDDFGQLVISYNGKEEVLDYKNGYSAFDFYKTKLKPTRKQYFEGIEGLKNLYEMSPVNALASSGKEARQKAFDEKMDKLMGIYLNPYSGVGLYGADGRSLTQKYNNDPEQHKFISDTIKKHKGFESCTQEEIDEIIYRTEHLAVYTDPYINTIIDACWKNPKGFEKEFNVPLTGSDGEYNYDMLRLDFYLNKLHSMPSFEINEDSIEKKFLEYSNDHKLLVHTGKIQTTSKEVIKKTLQDGFGLSFLIDDTEFLEDSNGMPAVTGYKLDVCEYATITGITDDGLYIVSFHGKKYYIDPDKASDYIGSFKQIKTTSSIPA